jgi:hypothetical protein
MFEIFGKFWNLMKILKFEFFEYFEIFKYFEIFEVLKFFVLRSFGSYNIFLVTDRSIYCHMTLSAMNYLLYMDG